MINSLINIDDRLFQFMHSWEGNYLALWRTLAIDTIYLVPIILVWFWFARRRELALEAFLAGIIAWEGVSKIVAHFVKRARPEDVYNIFISKNEGLFHRPDSSFPSDHTGFLTALVVIFWLAGEKRVAQLIFVIEIITVVSRVVVGFHWPGDIIGGMIIGTLTALLWWNFRRPLNKLITEPLVKIARRLHL